MVGSYPSAEMQSVYSSDPNDWAEIIKSLTDFDYPKKSWHATKTNQPTKQTNQMNFSLSLVLDLLILLQVYTHVYIYIYIYIRIYIHT